MIQTALRHLPFASPLFAIRPFLILMNNRMNQGELVYQLECFGFRKFQAVQERLKNQLNRIKIINELRINPVVKIDGQLICRPERIIFVAVPAILLCDKPILELLIA